MPQDSYARNMSNGSRQGRKEGKHILRPEGKAARQKHTGQRRENSR